MIANLCEPVVTWVDSHTTKASLSAYSFHIAMRVGEESLIELHVQSSKPSIMRYGHRVHLLDVTKGSRTTPRTSLHRVIPIIRAFCILRLIPDSLPP